MRYGTILLALLLAGCMTPKYAKTTRYYLDIRPSAVTANANAKSLGIRPLLSARPYEQKVVYRLPDFTLGSDAAFEWAELPRAAVTRSIADALAASGRFKDVGNAADMALPDWTLTGEVRRFDEDRTHDVWSADCELRLELRDTQSGEAVWAGTLSASVALDRNEHAALPLAMSQSIATVITEAVKEIVAR